MYWIPPNITNATATIPPIISNISSIASKISNKLSGGQKVKVLRLQVPFEFVTFIYLYHSGNPKNWLLHEIAKVLIVGNRLFNIVVL